MSSAQARVREALETYLTSADGAPLIELLEAHPELVVESIPGPYPDCHRICDVVLGRRVLRVLRSTAEDERILFLGISLAIRTDEAGVPLWLSGEALRRWVQEEDDDPSDEEVDWERFREGGLEES